MQQLTLGTRESALALAQTQLVMNAIARIWPQAAVAVRKIVTTGDKTQTTPPTGLKGLFTKELEDALLRREIDVAVHSCKDMPCDMPAGLVLAAVLERACVDDVLISKSNPLPRGACVGTCSVRRARQLLLRRPDLVLVDMRGNVPTRLRKLLENDTLHATVLARAGLERLGYTLENGLLKTDLGTFHAEPADMLPAIGQGAIALQCRVEDAAALGALNHEPTMRAIRAERELMRLLNGDCTLPVGVLTAPDAAGLRMRAILFGQPGEPPRHADIRAAEPEALAQAVWQALSE